MVRDAKDAFINGVIDLSEAKQVWASYKGHLAHGHTYLLLKGARNS